jgi:hypothetical protein
MLRSLVSKVHAQASIPRTTQNPLADVTDLGQVFAIVVNLILGVGWALVFVMLAMGFVQYVVSQGDKTKVDTAQKWLTYAVIGGVGLFFVMVLRNILPSLLGSTGTGPGGDFVSF